MPFYMTQWSYKDSQMKRFITEPSDRAEVVRVAIEACGGELHSFFYCFGQYDGVAISSFPTQEMALACWMSMFGAGRNKEIHTTVLIESTEGLHAMEIANGVVGRSG
jgi:uncharacterized protein with GYD domain